MRVVRGHENPIAADGNTAIHASGRHAGQSARTRTPVVPDLTATAGIERVEIVGRADIHHAIHDNRRHLSLRHVGQREHPLRRDTRHVAERDLRHGAVAITTRLPVVRRPTGLRRHFAIAAGQGFAQEMDAAIVAKQLHLTSAPIHDQAGQ